MLVGQRGTAFERLTTPTVVTKTDSYTLVVADLGKSFRMNSGSDKIFTLPSVGATEDGYQIEFVNISTGKLTITSVDTDTIDDSSGPGSIYSTDDLASLILEYCHAITCWRSLSGVGTWTTV